ncbi:MAG: Gx transporter family protein [bacterium]
MVSSGNLSKTPAQSVNMMKRISRIALYTALGATVAGVERFIPTPLPWVRLGLANGVALIVLYSIGWREAMLVNVLRSLVVGFLFGTWASPALALSMGGAVIAVIVMAAVKFIGNSVITPIGVSVVGAFAHMLTQFTLAALLIVHHWGIFVLTGPSLIAALTSGVLVGILAEVAIRRLPSSLRSGIVTARIQ